MLGWFAGRSGAGGAPVPSANTSVVAATTTTSAPITPPSSDSSAAPSKASPCVARDPGGGALRYAVVWGAVTCDGAAAPEDGYLPLETWFETDGSSRVILEVADLGRVELAPSTRLRILPAKGPDSARPGQKNEHRLELDHGTLNARIDAPPRLFIVETKAAAAVDLGCAYTLEVGEDGSGLLRVGKGEVALETSSGRAAVVHRGEVCETRVGAGAGTPFSVTSTPRFRRALSAWDFEHGSLDDVIGAATKEDTAGLVRAIDRASTRSDREKLVKKLDDLSAGPSATERDGVLDGERSALDAYRSRLAKAPIR
ncbi:MAG: FecR domain-containing protein [Polyangiaceae bacterium]